MLLEQVTALHLAQALSLPMVQRGQDKSMAWSLFMTQTARYNKHSHPPCAHQRVISRHSMPAHCKRQDSITEQLMKEDNHLIYIWNCKTSCERII
jgi:hypothetical protein